ncbi:Glycosyltransferase involved in cell wall bisynthesis [Gillisia sp. Hel1_33_143]|uniref:glycosyltransferase family 2 protein n=1 Tax=Gillisia sp. Hel1_33_143 TaxID=1336796 RepID=UPI00087C8875|nr:glycosyltransferase [Gillisia sp. Hel1_33_143]SDS23434.1 Glycosyltransferase involved in cell wall bisynthesis [Gillisia sp. Hel1_33_143]
MNQNIKSSLISIILPVYNGENYLVSAIESILTQTYQNFELIIVNDCSTDKSLEISENYQKKDSRIKIISNSTNKKLPISLNIGHKSAVGKYITWTSHDNLLKKNFLEELSTVIEQENVDIVFSNYDIIRSDNSIKRIQVAGPAEYLLIGNYIGASFLYKKEVFEGLNGYDSELFLIEDYDFWIRALNQYRFFNLDKNLYSYRIHGESLTSKINLEEEHGNSYTSAISKMLEGVAKDLMWSEEMLSFIKMIHLNKREVLEYYIRNKKIIELDLKQMATKNLDFKILKLGLIKSIRIILIQNKSEHNLKNLMKILKSERSILLESTFNKIETLGLIKNSLFH